MTPADCTTSPESRAAGVQVFQFICLWHSGMGYVGRYSLGSRCGSEAIATAFMIFLGEGTMANELLNKTKGHSMGFGWVRRSTLGGHMPAAGLGQRFPLCAVTADKARYSPTNVLHAGCLWFWQRLLRIFDLPVGASWNAHYTTVAQRLRTGAGRMAQRKKQ